MTIVINGRCVYCMNHIWVSRSKKEDGAENLVYHRRCDEAQKYWRGWDVS